MIVSARTSALDGLVGAGLLVEVLDNRLDDEVAVLEIVEARRALQIAERLVARVRRDLSLVDAVGQELLDPPQPLLEKGLLDLADDRLVAGLRRDLRDAGAHEAAAEDAHRTNLHSFS